MPRPYKIRAINKYDRQERSLENGGLLFSYKTQDNQHVTKMESCRPYRKVEGEVLVDYID